MPAELRTSIFFFLVATPERSHPFPSRTRKLSSPGPMVLQGQPCGRVGRCRGFEGPLIERAFIFFGTVACMKKALVTCALLAAAIGCSKKKDEAPQPAPAPVP